MDHNKIVAYILLLRPLNSAMMALAVLVGIVLHKSIISPPLLVLGLTTAFALTGASMVTNDYWDRYVDAINEPHRPIPRGIISARNALIYASILIVIGLGSAYFTNPLSFLIAIISLLTSLSYNWKGKEVGLIGNLMVSACVAIPLIYGGLLQKGVNITQSEFLLIFSFAIMAFLSTVGREVTKGIADIEGDKLRNVKTVAILNGPKKAAMISGLFNLIAIIFSVIVWYLGLVTPLYLPIVLIADMGFIWSALTLIKDPSKENAKKVKKLLLIWMFIGLLSFVIGGS